MSDAKDVKYGDEALKELLQGVDVAYEVVACTLGASYKQTLLQQSFGSPKSSNSGHAILKELELQEPFENMGALLMKGLASKMHDESGDGTTTAVVLSRALFRESVRLVTSGTNPVILKRAIDQVVTLVTDHMAAHKLPVTSEEKYYDVALAAASGDEEVAKIIASALEKVGKDGVITVEEGKSVESVIVCEEGMKVDRGYVSPYFVTDSDKLHAELSEPKILITDKKISSIQELLPALQMAATSATPILLIADDFENEVLSTLIVNRLRGTLKIAAAKAPGFGDQKKKLLEDLAILTNSTLITEDLGHDMKNISLEFLGSAERVVLTKDSMTIVGGKGEKEQIAARIKQLELELKDISSKYDREKLQTRKAKLQAGVGVIRVGAATESALQEKKRRIEGALNATLTAIQEGVVIGGLAAYIHAVKALDHNISPELSMAWGVVKKALEAPIRKLLDNAGELDPALIIDTIGKSSYPHGYNVKTKKIEDFIKSGILDPAKTMILALKLAASTAGVLMTTEAIVATSEA
ncbi:MAG: molecular chaperone GroEL [Chlamydiae bacterium]|nr:molecular chaperone GroEL [Chlamydiota bacterium]